MYLRKRHIFLDKVHSNYPNYLIISVYILKLVALHLFLINTKYTKQIAAVIFFVSVWQINICAQELNYRIDKISVEDGLSNNTVRSITQDKQGFMWFGTESGLNRYDGSNFKIYYNNPNYINSLTTNMIQSIFEDNSGSLWVITSLGGINRFTIEYNQITRYEFKHYINDTVNTHIFRKASVIDKDNMLWFSYSNNGLYSVDLHTNKLSVYKHKKSDKNSISSNNILSLYIDKKGAVLIGTAEGVLNQFNKETQKFTKYTIKKVKNDKQNRSAIWEIFEDHTGLLWMSLGDALYTFNRKTETSKIILKSNNKNKYYFSYGFVSSIIEDKQHNLWVGTDNGLYQYNLTTKKLINLHEQQNYKTVLTDKSILSLYQNKTGIIWVGTLGDGIYKIHPSLKAFKVLKHEADNPFSISPSIIRSVYYDRKGYLWVGTIDDGISVLKNNKKIAHFVHNENNPYSLSNNAVTGITQDSKNNYWISTGANGISVLKNFNPKKPANAKFTSYLHSHNDTNSINNNNVTVIFEDSRKNIWVGTNEGLDLFNPKTNQFIHPNFNLKDSSSLIYIQSNGILEDKSGALWVASWYGLYHFNYTFSLGKVKINKLKHFTSKSSTINTLSDNRITSIVEDKNGTIWIGTYGGGLNKLKVTISKANGKKQYSFSSILMSDGLPSNEIYGMHTDKHNNLWMSTNNGISKFNTENKQITNYSTQDGLQSNIFFWGASHKSYTGELFFGGTNGLNYFFPDSIRKESIALGIFFTNFKVKNKVINPGIDSPLKKQINFAKEIVLKHSFETFSIEFTALNYGSSRKFKYKFKLEGYNKEWVETDDNNKIATYTNLNPGDYVFKVLALNTGNAKNQLSAEIQIKILSPFWQTWWFYSLEVLFAVLLFFALIKLRERKLKSNNQKLELIVEKRTLKIKQQHHEILAQNEEIKQHNEEMRSHNEILNQYKKQLEELVEKRTKSLQEALEKSTESERLKTAFLENLSHEIRTPLNAIVGFSQLLENPELPLDDQLKYISKIQFGSDSLLNIVDSIMFVSKMQVGEYKLSKTEFVLGELLQEQYSAAKKALFAKKNHAVNIALNTNKLENLIIYSDRGCVSLILTSMIDNAIKFTEKGTIEVEIVKNTDDMLQFMVKDTGIGIHKNELAFVFDKFRKGENSKTKLYRGLGVGLALSKSLTDLLGGKIWFQSEKNTGSEFYFTIPYKK